jgi:outer membrane protein assembly factor BamB
MFLAGDFDDHLLILAFDLQGQKLWSATNGQSWKGPFPGARASCTLSEGRLYHMNAHGRVACFDVDTGREIWALSMFEHFGGKNLEWATSENLLVDGPRLILTPGGSRALMAAVDKRTGTTVWSTEPLRLGQSPNTAQQRLPAPAGAIDSCSYSSPILFSLHGRRYIVNCSLRHAFGVDADTGKLLWTQPYPTQYSVIAATPVVVGSGVFITAPDTKDGGKWFRILPGDSGAEVGWTTPLDTCHGGLVHVEGTLFGSWYRKRKGWAAVDATSGALRYQVGNIDQGPVLYADKRLYCTSQDGEVLLLKAAPDRFEVAGRFRLVPDRKSDAWTHPVIYQSRLYLRYHDTLSCYDIARR